MHHVQVTQKTAPSARLCAEFADLYAPWSMHTQKPPPKITAAGVLACHHQEECIIGAKPDAPLADLAADLGKVLRDQFTKYGDLVKYPRFRQAVCHKAVVSTWELISNLTFSEQGLQPLQIHCTCAWKWADRYPLIYKSCFISGIRPAARKDQLGVGEPSRRDRRCRRAQAPGLASGERHCKAREEWQSSGNSSLKCSQEGHYSL